MRWKQSVIVILIGLLDGYIPDNCHYLNPLFPKGKQRCIKK